MSIKGCQWKFWLSLVAWSALGLDGNNTVAVDGHHETFPKKKAKLCLVHGTLDFGNGIAVYINGVMLLQFN